MPIPDDLSPKHRKHHHPIVLIVPAGGPHSPSIPPLNDYPITLGNNLQRLHPLELHLLKNLFEKRSNLLTAMTRLERWNLRRCGSGAGYRKSTSSAYVSSIATRMALAIELPKK